MNNKYNNLIKRIEDPALFGKVAVVYGGNSSEREVSLWSGEAVLKALQAQGIDAHGVDTQAVELLSYLKSEQFDRVFIVLHGRGGEDGVLQGALEYLQVPYTGSGVLASSVGMDKLKTKQIWKALNLPVLESYLLEDLETVERLKDELSYPLAVKPAEEGSSIGVSRVDRAEDLVSAWQAAGGFNSAVFAENWIIGKGEYTCGLLNGTALPLIRMETDLAFYDYEAKYLRDDTRYYCPAGLPDEDESRFRLLCESAFKALGACGWGRIDLVVDQENNPWLLEINTVPGMTSHSLVPMAAKEAGISFEKLCWLILEETLAA
ncbi:D-alanine--D-alanine ligase [Ignatzschineria ureiclastica]|uniref:D-alanine--D-alanine ligase n=1 Tax=Ignatzschineria ureiclastica TaxID=472582 RepID=A0A2U2AD58_9GAMM|nr:D-alanine--D-alanine ligase [Ignatzschineria ureiclastica]PWD80594.1 D-alanine--D-alanine ligase [Ignatzschineria ureiclastica]GHA02348.1 D-alanine--D-alanine ligase [Ignatzschineria ureiclastica]